MGLTVLKQVGSNADITKLGLALACIAVIACSSSVQRAHAGQVHAIKFQELVDTSGHGTPERIETYNSFFEAGTGETNTLAITDGDNGTYTIADSTSPLTVGENCIRVNANTATCPHSYRGSVNINTGDFDDTITLNGDFATTTINAGAGSDVINDGAGRSSLDGGGGGHDQINAGGGEDTLSDGDSSSAFDDDILDGGSGTDTVKSYEKRTSPVTVDLGSGGPAGQHGENDQIENAENVYGGQGNDTLTGALGNPSDITGTAYSKLLGGAGDDVLTAAPLAAATALSGGDGNDQLTGGNGHDYIHGDAGDDKIDGSNGYDDLSGETGNDSISGGSSADRIYGGDGNDNLSGGAGNDTISAGRGRDRVAGNAGANDIITRDRQRDRVTCDRGSKGLVWVDRLDSVNRFCKSTLRKFAPPVHARSLTASAA